MSDAPRRKRGDASLRERIADERARVAALRVAHGYAVASGRTLLVWTVRPTRLQAIHAAVEGMRWRDIDITWACLREIGYRTVPVRIEPVISGSEKRD